MSRIETERAAFAASADRDSYLRVNSHLPGPRANLELLAAAADEVDREWAMRWAAGRVGKDPTDVFLIAVALAALGRFVVDSDAEALALLRRRAGDGEWRIREAVAIGLQRLGDERPDRLAGIARDWVSGTALEARAAVAAVAEPRLLKSGELVHHALGILDEATALVEHGHLWDDGIRVLRQALGYAWSVVVAAAPELGWPRFERLGQTDNPDIRWIVAENLKKNRIRRLGLTLNAK